MSHELRTPLALAQASVDSLTHLQLSPEQQRDSIEDIERATAQLTRIVDAILDFSRVEEGRWELYLREVDLETVVRRAVHESNSAAEARVVVEIPAITVRADQERLLQVVSNILQNALKYSAPDSPVRVRARRLASRGVACLDIRDWGQGIPLEDQPYLFTKFFRAGNARASAVAGTGLGTLKDVFPHYETL